MNRPFEVRTTEQSGRGLYATESLEPGVNILVCEPTVFALARKYSRSRCNYCTKEGENLNRCAGCKLQWYCDKECQKAAWTLDHKEECKMLKGEKQLPELTTLFLARLFRRVQREHGDSLTIERKGDELISLGELESNYDRLNLDQQEGLSHFLSKFQSIWGRKFPLPFSKARQLLDLVAAVKNNQFAICDEEQSNSELGSALYLNASLINHSCRPNAVALFNGTKLYIKALEKIEAGDEICIAYTDTKAKTDDRQMYLHTIYRFNCNCSNCTSEEGAKINRRKMEDLNGKVCKNADPIIESTNGAISDMQEFQKKREWSIMKDSIDGWLARKLLPDHNINWLRLNEFAFDAGIETKEWDLSLTAAGAVIPVYKEYYGTNHPTLGVFLMKFAKILLFIEKFDEAEEYFRSAFGILSLFYPPESSIRSDLHNLILECYEKSGSQKK